MQDIVSSPLHSPCLSCIFLYCTLEKEGRNQSYGKSLVKEAISSIRKKKPQKTLIGNLQIASIYTQPLFLLLQCLLLGDSVSGKRTLAVPSCYLFMCKVEKLPFLIQPFWTSPIFCSATSSLRLGRREEGGIILTRRLDEMNLFLHSSSRHTLLPLLDRNEEKLAKHLMPTISQFPEQVEGIYLCKHNPLCLWNSKQHFITSIRVVEMKIDQNTPPSLLFLLPLPPSTERLHLVTFVRRWGFFLVL